MKVIVATKNNGKIREFEKILSPYGFQPVSMEQEGISAEIAEDGETFEENAHIKAKAIYKKCGLPVIADDSGLEVEFLGGAPGIYSARYCGDHATDKDRCDSILEELRGVDLPLRGARFVCAIYFILSDDKEYCVTGTLEGHIGFEPQGENGFGYDPIFYVDEEHSLASLTDEEKNRISHRAEAAKKLKNMLDKEKIAYDK